MTFTKFRAASAALVGTLAVGALSFLFGPSASPPLEAQWEEGTVFEQSVHMGPDFADLAEATTPAVVRIESTREYGPEEGARSAPEAGIPEPFRRFFQRPEGWQGPTPDMESPPAALAGGSGFLVTADGYIVTNNHIVEESREIRVWLSDGRAYEAHLVGTDPTTDVAVIKIDAQRLRFLEWGSSKDLRVGEWVMAVGNPGVEGSAPLDYTVTSGIVSAKGRPLGIIRRSLAEANSGDELAGYAVENFIQTDAVINPGNSGGPLVDARGHVVGINTAILSTSGYFQGYGFAVPSDLAKHVVQDLIDDGTVRRAWLGLSMTAVAPEDAEVFGLPSITGAVVQSVTDNGPAAKAGLREADVIVTLDGVPVRRTSLLQQLVAEHDPGDRISLGVYRDRAERTLHVDLGEMPLQSAATPTAVARRARSSAETRLGMTVAPLTPELAARYGYDDSAAGLVVTATEPLGPVGRKSVVSGMRLLEVDGHHVSNLRDLSSALEGVESGKAITLKLSDSAGHRRLVNVRVQ